METIIKTSVSANSEHDLMDVNDFSSQYYQFIKDILEVEELEDSQLFEEFDEWDSLSALSIIANVGEQFGIIINSAVLREYNTVGSLKAYLEGKLRT